MDGIASSGTMTKDEMWQDITEEFKSSVSQLNLGELIRSDYFTLLEAMSAIELMDPRMDSGMVLKKCNGKIMNFEQAIRSGHIKINNLEPDELLGIIDDTYRFLVSWFEGHHLSQTVMTNLYLHGPERIEDRCLRIFSSAILKLTKFIDTMVCDVLCVEEEDFVLNMGKFNLDLQVTDQKVLSSLDDLCQHYEKLVDVGHHHHHQHSSKAHSNNQCTNSTLTNGDSNGRPDGQSEGRARTKTNGNIDNEHLEALICRLRFTYHFYACFFHINRNILKDSQTIADLDKQTDAQISKAIKLVQIAVQTCDQHLEKSLEHLDRWAQTTDLGIEPSPNTNDLSIGGNYPTIMGFEPLVNLKLLPPCYPRYPPIKSRPTTINHLRDLVTKMRHCISISAHFYQRSLIKSLNLIEEFSKYSQPNSCVISRSFLQALYLPGWSVKLFKEDIIESMSEYCEPLGQLMRGNVVRSQIINRDVFFDCSRKSFSQVVSIYGHNRSRQYERFAELIASFKNLQYQSFFLNRMACSWATYHLARMCIKYILSGIELELFSAYEYSHVFWYLYEILYKNEKEQLESARQFMESEALAEGAIKKAKGKKNRRKQSKTAYHDNKLLRNDAYRFLAGGIFLLTYGLKLQGKIRTPSMDFTSEEICFDHRFGSLTGTSVYPAYRLTLSKLKNLEHIYCEASDCFAEAKEMFNRLGRHENCLKVCKANMVVSRILTTNLESFKGREVEFNFDTHPSFPTVKFLN